MTEVAADRLATWINGELGDDRLKYLKLKLGLETLFINFSKLFVVYTISFLLNLLFATIIFHLSYYLIRRTAYGLHAQSSIVCTLLSILFFVGIPYLATLVTIPNGNILIIYLFNCMLLYFFAPSNTNKCMIINKKRRLRLRNQSIVMCLVIMIITLVIPNETVKTLLTMGAILASILTVPKDIFKRRNK